MKILGIDFETQGTDPKTVLPTEVGAHLFEDEPFQSIKVLSELIWDPAYPPQPEEIIRVTGITDKMLRESGKDPKIMFIHINELIEQCDYLMAHNALYDKTVYESSCKRLGLPVVDRPWICTINDINYKGNSKCRQLSHLALDHGVKMDNLVLHRAIQDVNLMVYLVRDNYPIKEVIQRKNIPDIIVRIVVPKPWEDGGVGKDKAKDLGYRWQEVDGKKFDLMWVKKIKKDELEKEVEKSPFKLVIVEGE